LQALLVKQINESGSLLKTTAVVETVPTASKVGTSMLKRVQHVARTPGGAAVGFYAVSQLLEGIGWVMEDGTYVKKIKIIDPSSDSGWSEVNVETDPRHATAELACQYYAAKNKVKFHHVYQFSDRNALCYRTETEYYLQLTKTEKPPVFDTKTVPLTATHLGALMMGTGYKDPDPNFNNDSINTGNWTGVPEAYTPDASGVGNELYESLEAKADNAPPTPDNKPAYPGDSRYNNDLSTNDNANDRSWGDEGTKGDSTGSTTTNPETGEQTTNTEFHLPPFCSWAFTVCEWYEKWQKTDTKVNEHLDRTKEHQEEEKGFWQTVKDWFDWSKDDSDLPDRDDSDLDASVEFEEKKVSINVSAQCPAPTYETVSLHGVTAQVKTSDYSYICNLDWLIKPFVLGFSMVSACFILFGFQRGGDD